MPHRSGGTGDTRRTPLSASCRARTRKDEAKGVSPTRPESTDVTNPARLTPRDWAISSSTSQNKASRATLVRCPASEKLRLIRPLRFGSPARSEPMTPEFRYRGKQSRGRRPGKTGGFVAMARWSRSWQIFKRAARRPIVQPQQRPDRDRRSIRPRPVAILQRRSCRSHSTRCV